MSKRKHSDPHSTISPSKPKHDVTAYSRPDSRDVQRLVKLLKITKSKDTCRKHLKYLYETLQELDVPGAETALVNAAMDLCGLLAQDGYLKVQEKELQVYTALCLLHALKFNPDAERLPFSDDQMVAVCKVVVSCLRHIKDSKSPLFHLYVSLLSIASQLSLFVVLLDIAGTEPLLLQLFQMVLNTVTEDNLNIIKQDVLHLLGTLLQQMDAPLDGLLPALLQWLLPMTRETQLWSFKLVSQLLSQQEDVLHRHISGYLVHMLDQQDMSNRDKHEMLYQVHRCCRQAVLPVLPHLLEQLESTQDSVRGAGVDLLGKLFTDNSAALTKEYESLYAVFMDRFQDDKMSIRLKMVAHAKALAMACGKDRRSRSIVLALSERTLDPEEKVRLVAVKTLGELAAARLELVDDPTLQLLVERLHDTQLQVRKEAATQLLAIFKQSCTAVSDRQSEDSPLTAWARVRALLVPHSLLAVAMHPHQQDMHFHVFDVLLRYGFFPSGLSARACAAVLLAMWQRCDSKQAARLCSILSKRAALQAEVAGMLKCRTQLREAEAAGDSDACTSMRKHLDAKLQLVLRRLTGGQKWMEGIEKLLQQKDNHIFRGLYQLSDPAVSLCDAVKAAKDVVQRCGGKGTLHDAVHRLTGALLPSLVAPEYLHVLLQELPQMASEEGDTGRAIADEVQEDCQQQGNSMLQQTSGLLRRVAKVAPLLYAGLLQPAMQAVMCDNAMIQFIAAQILASAGSMMREHSSFKQLRQSASFEHMTEELLALVNAGGAARRYPKSATYAVHALVNLLGESNAVEQLRDVCPSLIQRLQAVREDQLELLSCVAALTGLGRYLPQLYGSISQKVVLCAFGDILPLPGLTDDLSQATGAPNSPLRGTSWSFPSTGLEPKCQAIKMVFRSLEATPYLQGKELPRESQSSYIAAAKDAIHKACQILNMTDEDLHAFGCHTQIDVSYVRFHISAALLRLCRTYDAQLPPVAYATLSGQIQDPDPEARALFRKKLQRMLTTLREKSFSRRVLKYAPMLCLAAVDPIETNRNEALNLLCEVIRVYREEAAREALRVAQHDSDRQTDAIKQAVAAQGFCPEAMVPYLVYLLAHHPDFPLQEELCNAAPDIFHQFATILQFLLQPLVASSQQSNAGSTLPMLCKFLLLLRTTRDVCTEDDASVSLRAVADLATQTLLHLDGQTAGHWKDTARQLALEYPCPMAVPNRLFATVKDVKTMAAQYNSEPRLPPVDLQLDPICLPPLLFKAGAAAPSCKAPAGTTAQRGAHADADGQDTHAGHGVPQLDSKAKPRKGGKQVVKTKSARKNKRHADTQDVKYSARPRRQAVRPPVHVDSESSSSDADDDDEE